MTKEEIEQLNPQTPQEALELYKQFNGKEMMWFAMFRVRNGLWDWDKYSKAIQYHAALHKEEPNPWKSVSDIESIYTLAKDAGWKEVSTIEPIKRNRTEMVYDFLKDGQKHHSRELNKQFGWDWRKYLSNARKMAVSRGRSIEDEQDGRYKYYWMI